MINTIIKREGNKTRYLEQIYKLFPVKFDTYIEPFLGTGSVFLNLPTKPKYCFLNDHDELCYYSMLTIKQQRLDDLLFFIENTPVYFEYMDNILNSLESKEFLFEGQLTSYCLEWLAIKILKMNNSMYGSGNTLRINKNNAKYSTIENIEKIKEVFIDSSVRITRKDCIDFIKSLSFRKISEARNCFVYLDPPYVKEHGSLKANQGFTLEKIDSLLSLCRDRSLMIGLSHSDGMLDLAKKHGLTTRKLNKVSTGKINTQEYYSFNYKISDQILFEIDFEYTEEIDDIKRMA